MGQFILTIKEWPIILQGALGSGLFWLVLVAAQICIRKLSVLLSKFSHNNRRSWLVSRECKHDAFGNSDDASAAFATSALIYRSLRFLYKALMWLCLGFIFQRFIDVGIIIGVIGSLYYLIKAYDVVGPFGEGENTPEEHQKIINELYSLPEIKTNKSSKGDAETGAPS